LKNQDGEDVNVFEVSKSSTVVIFGVYNPFDACCAAAMCSCCTLFHIANMYLPSLSQGQHPRLHQGKSITSSLATSYLQLTRFSFFLSSKLKVLETMSPSLLQRASRFLACKCFFFFSSFPLHVLSLVISGTCTPHRYNPFCAQP
jgi:hypothetical protein